MPNAVMNSLSKLIARKMLKLRIHEAKGIAFQKLFELVMGYKHAGFTPIKPHGNVGDRKNDGFIPGTGQYFQVYAPEDPESKTTAQASAKKAVADFEGLKRQWDASTPIQDFRFVFNDEYCGCPPDLLLALTEISRTHSVPASVMLAKDLEALAMALTDDQLMDVVGCPVPDAVVLDSVDFGVLREVINHVLAMRKPTPLASILDAPDFDEKIRFNGLSRVFATLLTYASFQSEAVEDYFSKNSTFARQQVRDHLSSLYSASKTKLKAVTAEEGVADMVFVDILQAVTPTPRVATSGQLAVAQEAAIIVMAFYFEACDIFESPDAAS